MEYNKLIGTIEAKLGYLIIIIGLSLACFWCGALYEQFSEPNESVKDFFMSSKVIEYKDGQLPQEIKLQKCYFDKIKNALWISLGGLLIFLIGDYTRDKENHFITQLIKKRRQYETNN
jgi:hypothetical protein